MRLEIEKTSYNDEVLLRQMAGGDQAAFSCLYRRHWESLYVAAVGVIGSKEDAADIVQEVFLSLWRRRQELVLTGGSLQAYLRTSAKYKAIHYIEKNITRRNYLELLQELAEANTVPSSEVLLQVKEVHHIIHAAIENMPLRMRTVYELSRQEELSHREIAARLNISEETVKKHIQHALQLIRTALGRSTVSLTVLLFALLS